MLEVRKLKGWNSQLTHVSPARGENEEWWLIILEKTDNYTVNLRKRQWGNIIPTRRWEPDKSDCGCKKKKTQERDLNIAVISLVRMCFRSDVAVRCRLKKKKNLRLGESKIWRLQCLIAGALGEHRGSDWRGKKIDQESQTLTAASCVKRQLPQPHKGGGGGGKRKPRGGRGGGGRWHFCLKATPS